MDPDKNLEEQRTLTKWIIEHEGKDCSAESLRLAELVIALDEWLQGGGFVPKGW